MALYLIWGMQVLSNLYWCLPSSYSSPIFMQMELTISISSRPFARSVWVTTDGSKLTFRSRRLHSSSQISVHMLLVLELLIQRHIINVNWNLKSIWSSKMVHMYLIKIMKGTIGITHVQFKLIFASSLSLWIDLESKLQVIIFLIIINLNNSSICSPSTRNTLF